MRALKKILFITLLFLTTVLVIAYFLPAGYTLNRSAEINAEPAQVYSLVAGISHWKNWHHLLTHAHVQENDTVLNREIRWSGTESMAGTIRITGLREKVYVRSEILFDKPAGMYGTELWTFEKTGNGTRVSLQCEGNLRFPIGRLLGSYIQRRIAEQAENSLAGLKQLAENDIE